MLVLVTSEYKLFLFSCVLYILKLRQYNLKVYN